jgi:hypothetical protein
MASLKAALEFRDGVLASASEEPGATLLPGVILAAAEEILPLLAASMEPGDRIPRPSLYRITVQGDRITFTGGEADAPVQIRLFGTAGGASR